MCRKKRIPYWEKAKERPWIVMGLLSQIAKWQTRNAQRENDQIDQKRLLTEHFNYYNILFITISYPYIDIYKRGKVVMP